MNPDNFQVQNKRICVSIDRCSGIVSAIEDRVLNVTYPVHSRGFSVVINGKQYFEGISVSSVRMTERGAMLCFKDRGVQAILEYRVHDTAGFFEKELTLLCTEDCTVDALILEDVSFPQSEEIVFHDDQSLWHVPVNYFIRYKKGGIYCGLEYPYWDSNRNTNNRVLLGFSPKYPVAAGQRFVAEKTFFGVYRKEGIYRESYGPYPGKSKLRYPDLFEKGGLNQHFPNNQIPEDAGMPIESLDWGEVWGMQDFVQSYLPMQPLPEEGYWVWQNGWWAGLFSPDIRTLDTLERAGIRDVMTAAMYYGHDNHPSTEPKYIRDMAIDPVGFPIMRQRDEEGVKNGTPGWHRIVAADRSDANITGYSQQFEAPALYDSFAAEARNRGIHVSSFSTPNNGFLKKPEWYSRHKDGTVQSYFSTHLSCPACDEYMDFQFDALCRVIDKYNPRLWCFDGRWMNYQEIAGYHFGWIGDSPCYSANHGHVPGDDRYRSWKNIERFKEQLRQRYPKLCIEQYYGLKRGGIWSLRQLNADENYYEMGSNESNRLQTWHNECSRFRPTYLNYSSVFGSEPAEFERSMLSALSTSAYCQMSRGYAALRDYPECAEIYKRWKQWGDDNHRFLCHRRCLFGMPGAQGIDGSAHILINEGYVFAFTVPDSYVVAQIPFNRWIGLSEDNTARYRVEVVTAMRNGEEAAECILGATVVGYGETLCCRITPDTTVILSVKPANLEDVPVYIDLSLTSDAEWVNAF